MAIDQRKLSQWETNFQKSQQTLASTAKVSSLADQRAARVRAAEADRPAVLAALASKTATKAKYKTMLETAKFRDQKNKYADILRIPAVAALQKKFAVADKVKSREALANLNKLEFENRNFLADKNLKEKLADRATKVEDAEAAFSNREFVNKNLANAAKNRRSLRPSAEKKEPLVATELANRRSKRQAGGASAQVVTEEHLRLNTMVTATDAPSNLFEVQMRAEGMAPATEYALLFRTGEFTPPAPALKMLDIPYKGYQVRIPTTAINHTKTLQFKIRVDNQYDVYQELLRLRNTGFDPSDGVKETPPTSWSIRVLALADKSSTAAEQLGTYYQEAASRLVGWEFSGVIVEAVELSAFSHESSNPVFATLKVSYSSYKDILPDSSPSAEARLPILQGH